MLPYLQKLHDVLNAAEAVLAAREAEMLTTDEWDALEHAVAAATEPPPDERDETFTVEDGALVRRVVPRKGQPYEHRCPQDAFEAIAAAAEEAAGGFVLEGPSPRDATALDAGGRRGRVPEGARLRRARPWPQARCRVHVRLRGRHDRIPRPARGEMTHATDPDEERRRIARHLDNARHRDRGRGRHDHRGRPVAEVPAGPLR